MSLGLKGLSCTHPHKNTCHLNCQIPGQYHLLCHFCHWKESTYLHVWCVRILSVATVKHLHLQMFSLFGVGWGCKGSLIFLCHIPHPGDNFWCQIEYNCSSREDLMTCHSNFQLSNLSDVTSDLELSNTACPQGVIILFYLHLCVKVIRLPHFRD